MTNVVEFHTRPKHPQKASYAAERAAVVADLMALKAGIREVVERTVELSEPPVLELERTVQHLVDALHHLEGAADVLTERGGWTPF